MAVGYLFAKFQVFCGAKSTEFQGAGEIQPNLPPKGQNFENSIKLGFAPKHLFDKALATMSI